jgi:radical SAM superfamily enzyme YgiQ (UPF0313 family)
MTIVPAKKKLILINPCVSPLFQRFFSRLLIGKNLPFSLLTLAAITPEDYNVKIINLKPLWKRSDFTADTLVGITCITMTSFEAYRLADNFRAAGAKVVMGGPHVTCLADEALQHADSVVVGEAESVWSDVLNDYESGNLKKVYAGEPLDDYFSPVFDYFMKLDPRIFLSTGLQVSRGCKYRCDFCGRPEQKLRFVKVDQAVALIEKTKNAAARQLTVRPTIFFKDNNIFSSPPYAKELFSRMIPLKIRWEANASLDIAFDDEALRLAKESGCRSLYIGLETIHPQDFPKTALYDTTSVLDYLRLIRKIKSYGIKVWGAFILGFDNYTHRDYWGLLRFLMRSGLWFAPLSILVPFPGTPLFERLKKENRILTYDWRKYYPLFNVVFKPKNMSPLSLKLWFLVIRIVSFFFSPLLISAWLIIILAFLAGYLLSHLTN